MMTHGNPTVLGLCANWRQFWLLVLAAGLYLMYFIVTRPVVAQVVSKHIESSRRTSTLLR